MDLDPLTRPVTILFTDIEGSTRLWEREPDRMRVALACHDALTRRGVEESGGTVVKMVGDGVHAVFDEPRDAVLAALRLQQALLNPGATNDMTLRVRCGVHMGVVEQRDHDYFGGAVNRAARIMSAAHGGQILLSQAVAACLHESLPEEVSLRDLGAVRLRDLGNPEHVYQVVHPALRSEFPALRSLEATPNNLPRQVTSFIGRERESAALKGLLSRTRWLTLVGTGGLGKTRLSLQVAADVLDDYPDGVWFVELAAIANGQLLPQAVASVLGVKEDAAGPVIHALVKCVSERRLLLVLDNCEHLVHECADLAVRLLSAGPGIKLLASSREPLRGPGETTYPVPPLALPDPREAQDIDTLSEFESVRLFVDRAQAAQPAFAVTPGNASALAAICRRLDGIPLAIELAAARVRSMSVEQIESRLGDRFRLLTTGSRTALPRQQTLRALIDWSFDLLDAREQALFTRLSVMAGSYSLDAAEAVGAGEAIASTDVLDLLAGLVEKSLVELEADGERYRMLETVCAYAYQRLCESGELDAARTRHLAFFMALAREAASKLWGTEQGAWVAKLDRERENLLAALAWCGEREQLALQGLRFATSLQLYWLPSGMLEFGYRVTTQALAHPAAQEPTVERCGACYAAGQLAYDRGRFADTALHAGESLAIAREIGDDKRAVDALLFLGYAADEQGDRDDGLACFEEAVALARRIGDRARMSYALNALAGHHLPGNESVAVPLFEEATSLAREAGDIDAAAVTLQNIARALLALDRSNEVPDYLRQSLDIAMEIGSTRTVLLVLDVCAALAGRLAQPARCARFLAAANAQLERLGWVRTESDTLLVRPAQSLARGLLGDVAFAAASEAGRQSTLDDMVAEAKAWLADLGRVRHG